MDREPWTVDRGPWTTLPLSKEQMNSKSVVILENCKGPNFLLKLSLFPSAFESSSPG